MKYLKYFDSMLEACADESNAPLLSAAKYNDKDYPLYCDNSYTKDDGTVKPLVYGGMSTGTLLNAGKPVYYIPLFEELRKIGYTDEDIANAQHYFESETDGMAYSTPFSVGKKLYDNWNASTTSINSWWRDDPDGRPNWWPSLDYSNVTDCYKAWHGNNHVTFMPTLKFPKVNHTSSMATFWYTYREWYSDMYFDSAEQIICLWSNSSIQPDNVFTIHAPKCTKLYETFGAYTTIYDRGGIIFDTPSVTSVPYLFYHTELRSGITLENLPYDSITDYACMFFYSTVTDDTYKFDFSKINWNIVESLEGCLYPTNLGDINVKDIPDIYAPKCTISGWMACNAGGDFTVGNIEMPVCTDAEELVSGSDVIKIGNITMSKCTKMIYMFYKCNKLQIVGNITAPITSLEAMFYGCKSLEIIGTISCESVTDVTAAFSDSDYEVEIPLKDFAGFVDLGKAFVSTDSADKHKLDLKMLSQLTSGSVENIVNNLGTVDSSVTDATIVFASNIALSDTLIATASAKNWTITNYSEAASTDLLLMATPSVSHKPSLPIHSTPEYPDHDED